MGDGILALFGAPLAHEDHALRACCAALAMQDAVRRMQDVSWKARGAQPEIRVDAAFQKPEDTAVLRMEDTRMNYGG